MVGLALTLILADLGHYALIPFTWMVFYGLAVWSVGLFSPVEVKVLGAAFLTAGLFGVLLLDAMPLGRIYDYLLVSMAATFGGFHLAYGAVVWARHGG